MVDSQYIIKLHGLEEGVHSYEFEADGDFFRTFGNRDILSGKIKAFSNLDKKQQMLTLALIIEGSVEVICDRCLENVVLNIYGETRLFFKYGDHEEEVAHDLIVLPYHAHELDISKYIYETSILALPYKKMHREDECNPEMMGRIQGFDEEYMENSITDPRWDKLKDIIKN